MLQLDMKMLFRLIRILFLLLIIFYGCQRPIQLTDADKLANFFNKNAVNILVTDSGLGGVSVAADVFERMNGSGVFEKVNVIFFNAQPHIKSGYNSMETTEQKMQIFENALKAMNENFKPDIILIACNTLSVLYPLTTFSKETEIPVIGIVETGVDQIKKELDNDHHAKVLIFATKTTVQQNSHKKMLIEMGVDEKRIITQACPKLAGSIERGTQSDETLGLVDQYVSEALNKISEENSAILVSFNCTHYGYISDVFEKKFIAFDRPLVKLIDPNPRMADFIFIDKYLNRYKKTEVSIKVVSQPELNEKRIESIGSLIEKVSPQTAIAMRQYQFTPDLFEWESIANSDGNKN